MHDVIGSNNDRAGYTGREARVDATRGRFERVRMLKHHRRQQPPQRFPGEFEGLPASEMHGLCLESFLRQHLLLRERRRAVGSLLLL